MIDKAKEYISLAEKVDKLKDELDAAKAELRDAEAVLVAEMADNECQKVDVKGRLLYLKTVRSVSFKSADKEELHARLTTHGLGDIIKPSVSPSTLTAAIREVCGGDEWDGALPDWLEGVASVFETVKVGNKKS